VKGVPAHMLVAAAALAVVGCGSSAESESTPRAAQLSADLRIAVWPQGKQRAARPQRWTLRCGPVSGTLPSAARACKRLLALSRPFRPVPRGAVCTQIYGGPQVAEVHGSLRGSAVTATFTRRDGCQIHRWDRVRFLFPGSGAS
jgi:Subtilisin inhibitor-like